nr:3',5'-cyclic-nucleotide phosphodiesterase (PDEase) (3':5'-CNP) [Polyrhizophydium stewartii]
MLLAILNICSKEELDDDEGAEGAEVSEQEQRRIVIKNKIKAVGRMARVFATLREEKESIMELKNVLGVQHLPPGTLALGAEGIKQGASLENLRFALLHMPLLTSDHACLGNTARPPRCPSRSAAIQSFDEAKKADEENERLPPLMDGRHAPTPAAPIFGRSPEEAKPSSTKPRINPLKFETSTH